MLDNLLDTIQTDIPLEKETLSTFEITDTIHLNYDHETNKIYFQYIDSLGDEDIEDVDTNSPYTYTINGIHITPSEIIEFLQLIQANITI